MNDTRQMTLTELRDRLTAVIEENEKRGWSERNNLPAAIEVERRTPTGQNRTTYLTAIRHVSCAMHGLGDAQYCGVLRTDEAATYNPRKKVSEKS